MKIQLLSDLHLEANSLVQFSPAPDAELLVLAGDIGSYQAPTLHSADPRYGLTPGTAAFCNALNDLLPLADVWMHGHLHCPQDQRVGRCRIVANPLGYTSKDEQAGFAPMACVSVPDQNGIESVERTLTSCNPIFGDPRENSFGC